MKPIEKYIDKLFERKKKELRNVYDALVLRLKKEIEELKKSIDIQLHNHPIEILAKGGDIKVIDNVEPEYNYIDVSLKWFKDSKVCYTQLNVDKNKKYRIIIIAEPIG